MAFHLTSIATTAQCCSRAGKNLRACISRTALQTYFTYSPEPSQPIPNKEPTYVKDAKEAFKCLQSGSTVFIQGAAATPLVLVDAMTAVGKEKCLEGVKVCHMHTEGKAPYTEPDCEGIFRSLSLFMAANVRKPVADGRSDCVPIFLSEIPKLFTKGVLKPDISLIQVSPLDKHGYCSLGTSVDCVRSAISHSAYIIAQINPQMPRTFGDACVHSSHFDFAINVDAPLADHGEKPISEEEAKIGKLIAENLIKDGATLQMGIGSIPDAVLAALTNHKDLGIHSEMFSGGIIPLVENGLITNNKKTLHRGKTIGSFLIGTRKLYDFVDDNPSVEMLAVDYVNNPEIIARQPNMAAINSCIEIDLTGQVVSDSIGTRMYSGFGGQVDFLRGAAQAIDGKGVPIVAMTSATKKGASKISPTIKKGAGVVTSRAMVHFIVTEHGIACMFGKTLRQRAYALINVAHPDHREELEKAAFERLKCMPADC